MISNAWKHVWEWISRRPLLVILVGGLLIRLVNIQTRPMQYDDLFSFYLSRRSLAEIVQGTAADTMPPLFYFILHFWQMASQEVWFLRLLSVLFSVAAVGLLYGLVRQLFDPQTAAWAALIAAISPFQYYHAQDIRNYSLLLVCQLGFAWFAARLWLRDMARLTLGRERWDWLGLVLCGTASLYLHNIAALAFGIPNVFLLFQRRWRLFGRLVLAQAVILLLNLPWLMLLPEQFAKVQRAWSLWKPGFADVIQAGLMVTTGLPFTGVWLAIAAVLTIETLALVILILSRQKDVGAVKGRVLYLVCFALGLPALIFTLSYVIRPIFVPRGFIVASMAYYGLASVAIARGWSNGAGKLVLAGFILSALIGLPNQFAYNGFPRSPLKEATRWIETQIQPGEVVVHDNKLSYFPASYYAPELSQVFVADAAGTANDTFAPGSQQAMQIFPSADLQAAVNDHPGIFFVAYSRTIDEYQAMGFPGHPSLMWLNEGYELKSRTVFRDVEVYHFTQR